MIKYVFIQDEPYFLPKVLDKYLREFHDSTAGISIQSVAQGKRTVFETAKDLYKLYGFRYFQWKLRQVASYKIKAKLFNDLFGSTRTCYSVKAVARKYGVPVTEQVNVNTEEFRKYLRDAGVEFMEALAHGIPCPAQQEGGLSLAEVEGLDRLGHEASALGKGF